jgi:hypothetical protein
MVAQRPMVSARWETLGTETSVLWDVSRVAIPPVHHLKSA